jgi:hypothetical protein
MIWDPFYFRARFIHRLHISVLCHVKKTNDWSSLTIFPDASLTRVFLPFCRLNNWAFVRSDIKNLPKFKVN